MTNCAVVALQRVGRDGGGLAVHVERNAGGVGRHAHGTAGCRTRCATSRRRRRRRRVSRRWRRKPRPSCRRRSGSVTSMGLPARRPRRCAGAPARGGCADVALRRTRCPRRRERFRGALRRRRRAPPTGAQQRRHLRRARAIRSRTPDVAAPASSPAHRAGSRDTSGAIATGSRPGACGISLVEPARPISPPRTPRPAARTRSAPPAPARRAGSASNPAPPWAAW